MKYYFFIGILLIIIFCSLVIDIFFNSDNVNITINEDFQGFSASQVEQMDQCTSAETATDISCIYFQYYDQNQKLLNGYFRNVPYNFYIDSNNTLQPVPFGNVVTENKRGYRASSTTSDFSKLQQEQAELEANAIETPDICREGDSDYTDRMKCFDTQYVIMNNELPSLIYDRIRIPDGYYVDTTKDRKGILTKVPFGHKINPDKRGITPTDEFQQQMENTRYDPNNFNITYNTDPTENTDMLDNTSTGPGKTWILDESGQLISVPLSSIKGSMLYYKPGTFRFGAANYVPNYEESVFLSKLTNTPIVSPYIDEKNMGGGFCEYYKNHPDELEQKCNDISANMCASNSCCVLLGGKKCVYGDAQGPHFKSHYNNFLITTPEFYYYQGKCYGKCM